MNKTSTNIKIKYQSISQIMKIVLMFFSIILSSISLLAQQTVATSGGNASGGGGTVSYTVGQVAYTTSTGSNGSSAQGVQQPFEISVETALEEAKNISLEMSVYPNPVTDYLILKIDGEVKTQCIASLHNLNGVILQTLKIETNETTIPMQGYSSGTYFLKVAVTTQNIALPRVIKTFKIIKH